MSLLRSCGYNVVLTVTANPSRPNTLGYAGSEEFIRLQFEEYLLALLSATKYKLYIDSKKDEAKQSILDIGEKSSIYVEFKLMPYRRRSIK